MSFGYYRVGSQVDPKRAFGRYATALAEDAAKYGTLKPGHVLVRDLSPKPVPPNVGATLLDGEPAAPGMDRQSARAQGYTGSQCDKCQSLRMRVSGHCEVCEECGTTTGCS